MKNLLRTSISAILALPHISGLAQTIDPLTAVAPPSAPYVAELPAKARWTTARISALPAPGAQNDQLAAARQGFTIESVLWNSVKTDIQTRPGSEAETLVYYGGFVLVDGTKSSSEKAPVLVQQIPGTNYSNLRSPGWLGTDWISSQFYVEPQIYQRQLSGGAGDAAEEITHFYTKSATPDWENEYVPELKAWIRVADKVPVAVSIDGAVFEFQVLPPPNSPPLMSAQQSQKLLELKDQNERMVRLQQRSTAAQN